MEQAWLFGVHNFSMHFFHNSKDPLDQSKRSECREDTYVRVVGNMKSFNDGQIRSVMAFNMVPVTDFNEITFHFIDVIHAQLNLKKV